MSRYFTKDDKGKKVYKISFTVPLKVEQTVVVDGDEDAAFDHWLDKGGIDHDQITTRITTELGTVETDYIEAFTGEHKIELLGTVVPDPDNEDEEYEDLVVA
jgi:hypothetical protein